MQALIFAAGLGTRLRPLTDDRPKALVEVAGATMLERVIRRVVDAGVTDVVVNIHHFGEKIIDFLDAHDFGVRIVVSDERDRLLDTGGGVVKARQFFSGKEPVLLHNADILTDFDIREMLDAHVSTGADATILVAPRATSRYFLFDADNRLQGWTNTVTGEVRPPSLADAVAGLRQLAFGGVHIVSPSIIDRLVSYSRSLPAEMNGKFSITPFYVDVCRQLCVKAYQPRRPYRWHDVGKLESLAEASREFKE
ncbi:MAG: nucleotidyltransferase family protein [Muribaculaceae bacterium]|nr:nucleotidyltransferase family protein [Muribaculaceae bacterium]